MTMIKSCRKNICTQSDSKQRGANTAEATQKTRRIGERKENEKWGCVLKDRRREGRGGKKENECIFI